MGEIEPPSGERNHQYDQAREGADILTLEKTQNPPRLEKISSKNIFNRFDACPNFYKKCLGADQTCMGDMNKPRACEIFFEKNLTAPPKKIDYNKNVLEQLKTKRLNYENPNQARIKLEQAQNEYKQTLRDLAKLKKDYFI